MVHALAVADYDAVVATHLPVLVRARATGRIRAIGVTESFAGDDPRHETLCAGLDDGPCRRRDGRLQRPPPERRARHPAAWPPRRGIGVDGDGRGAAGARRARGTRGDGRRAQGRPARPARPTRCPTATRWAGSTDEGGSPSVQAACYRYVGGPPGGVDRPDRHVRPGPPRGERRGRRAGAAARRRPAGPPAHGRSGTSSWASGSRRSALPEVGADRASARRDGPPAKRLVQRAPRPGAPVERRRSPRVTSSAPPTSPRAPRRLAPRVLDDGRGRGRASAAWAVAASRPGRSGCAARPRPRTTSAIAATCTSPPIPPQYFTSGITTSTPDAARNRRCASGPTRNSPPASRAEVASRTRRQPSRSRSLTGASIQYGATASSLAHDQRRGPRVEPAVAVDQHATSGPTASRTARTRARPASIARPARPFLLGLPAHAVERGDLDRVEPGRDRRRAPRRERLGDRSRSSPRFTFAYSRTSPVRGPPSSSETGRPEPLARGGPTAPARSRCRRRRGPSPRTRRGAVAGRAAAGRRATR